MEELPPPRFCVKLTQVGSRYEGQDIENFKLDNGVFIPTTLAGETRLYGTPVSFEMEIINGAPQWSLEASAGKTIIKVSASTLASAVALLRDRLQYAGRLTRDAQKKKYNASSEYLYDAFGLGCATDRAVLMGTGEGSLTKIPIDAFRCSWQSAFEPPEKSFTETLVGRVVTTGDGRRGVIVREGTRVDRDGDSKDDIAIIGREGIVKMRSSDVRENLLPATLITSTRSAYSLEKHGFVVAEEDDPRRTDRVLLRAVGDRKIVEVRADGAIKLHFNGFSVSDEFVIIGNKVDTVDEVGDVLRQALKARRCAGACEDKEFPALQTYLKEGSDELRFRKRSDADEVVARRIGGVWWSPFCTGLVHANAPAHNVRCASCAASRARTRRAQLRQTKTAEAVSDLRVKLRRADNDNERLLERVNEVEERLRAVGELHPSVDVMFKEKAGEVGQLLRKAASAGMDAELRDFLLDQVARFENLEHHVH